MTTSERWSLEMPSVKHDAVSRAVLSWAYLFAVRDLGFPTHGRWQRAQRDRRPVRRSTRPDHRKPHVEHSHVAT